MNLLRLRAKARQYAGNIETGDYTAANLDNDLNEGYRYICQKIVELKEDYFEEQKSKFDLVALSSLYSLPTDFLKFKQLRLAYTAPSDEGDYKVAVNKDVASVDNPQVDEESVTTSNPIVDLTNNYMRIKPTPTADSTNGGEIYYVARPSALTLTGDSPVFPEDWHFLIAKYGAKEMCAEKGSWDRHDRLDQEIQRGIMEMKQALAERELNKDRRFVNPLETGKKTTTLELY